jgi:hypothetical protein
MLVQNSLYIHFEKNEIHCSVRTAAMKGVECFLIGDTRRVSARLALPNAATTSVALPNSARWLTHSRKYFHM